MSENSLLKRGIILIVIVLFFGANVTYSIGEENGINSAANTGDIITKIISSESDTATSRTTIYNGSLSGYVNDTSMNPIEGARVRVYFHETYEENYTDSSGYYHVTNIPICYCLKNATCSKEGYKTEWVLLGITENTTYDFVLTPLEPYPVFNGTIGENGWYVSCVTITFFYDPEVIAEVHYRIDGGSWQIYTEPFEVCEDGTHTILYYAVDIEGNQGTVHAADFKVDQTPPTIDLLMEADKKDGIWYVIFTVICSDATSGMDYVEFYMDDELMCIDNAAPFEWIYTVPFVSHVIGLIFNPQFSEKNVTFFALIATITNEHNSSSVLSKYFYAIAYDMAGNSETDDISGISYIPPGVYMFQQLTFPNSYEGYIGKFFIRATFDYE